MINLFRKKIKFYSENTIITDKYPIYPASDYKRKWVKSCASAFQKYKKLIDNRSNLITAAKCPGMKAVMEKGYIVTTWCDITIETSKDNPSEYNVYYPDTLSKTLKDIGYNNPIVSDFNLKNSPLKIPTGDNQNHILKFWVPWCIQIPRGYQLMFMPVQFDDNTAFTACGGILDEGNNIQFNVHVYWHNTNGRVFIPAGTPLCQLVPIKVDPIDVEFKEMNQKVKKLMLTKLYNYTNKFIIKS